MILLFRSWILDTRTKFVMGCIGVILLGIGTEAILCFRRKLQKRRILIRISGEVRRGKIVTGRYIILYHHNKNYSSGNHFSLWSQHRLRLLRYAGKRRSQMLEVEKFKPHISGSDDLFGGALYLHDPGTYHRTRNFQHRY